MYWYSVPKNLAGRIDLTLINWGGDEYLKKARKLGPIGLTKISIDVYSIMLVVLLVSRGGILKRKQKQQFALQIMRKFLGLDRWDWKINYLTGERRGA